MKGRMMDTVGCNCSRGAHTCLKHLGKRFTSFCFCKSFLLAQSVCSMLRISPATCTLPKGCSITVGVQSLIIGSRKSVKDQEKMMTT